MSHTGHPRHNSVYQPVGSNTRVLPLAAAEVNKEIWIVVSDVYSVFRLHAMHPLSYLWKLFKKFSKSYLAGT